MRLAPPSPVLVINELDFVRGRAINTAVKGDSLMCQAVRLTHSK